MDAITPLPRQKRHRNEQREARRLQRAFDLKYTHALRIVRGDASAQDLLLLERLDGQDGILVEEP